MVHVSEGELEAQKGQVIHQAYIASKWQGRCWSAGLQSGCWFLGLHCASAGTGDLAPFPPGALEPWSPGPTETRLPREPATLLLCLLLSPTLPGRLGWYLRVQALTSNCLVLDPSSTSMDLIWASDSVSFFIYKMGLIVTAPTSWGCCKVPVR